MPSPRLKDKKGCKLQFYLLQHQQSKEIFINAIWVLQFDNQTIINGYETF